jgi:hypothetical protein
MHDEIAVATAHVSHMAARADAEGIHDFIGPLPSISLGKVAVLRKGQDDRRQEQDRECSKEKALRPAVHGCCLIDARAPKLFQQKK